MTDGYTEGYVMRNGRRIAVGTRTFEVGNKPKSKSTEPWVKVPLRWARTVADTVGSPKAFFVTIWLLHLAWKTKSNTFSIPNGQLGTYGIHRNTKAATILALEQAGLIKVERRPRKTPIVTLII